MPPAADDEKTEIRDVPEEQYPCLEVIAGPKGLGRYFIRPGKNYIGRSDDNDIVLDDSSVSRRHAEVVVSPDGIVLTDLGSRNGTRVGGQKIKQPAPLTHETRLRIGLFQIRLLTKEAPPAQPEAIREASEEPVPEEPVPADEGSEPPPGEEDLPPEGYQPEGHQEAASTPRRSKRWLLYLSLGALLVVAAIAGTPQLLRFFHGKKRGAGRETVKQEKLGSVGGVATGEKVTLPPALPSKRPVFLDFSSSPIPAEIFFGATRIGITPFRTSTLLEVGRWYEGKALFQLPEIGEVLEERLQFTLPQGAEILPINFAGKVGLFKVASLPREAQLYLEGYFEKDPYRAKPIKFAEIVFGKPIFVPFGRYVLELRKNRQLGQSQTFLDEVVYRREFFMNVSQTNYTVDVKDEDLKNFPVQITSIPPGARALIDSNEVGTTPYTGTFPVGEHLLTLKQEGYFDFSQVIKMDLNAPYVAEIQLKTSEAGELVNKAAAYMKDELYAQGLPILVEAFNKNPSPREVAQISYLVGVCYLRQKQFKEANDYFTKAVEHPDYRYAARVGIADLTFQQGDQVKALQLLVEVLISSQDPAVRLEAGKLFQRISPLKSVVYVTSEPAGARVLVNGQEIGQATPLILHDLGVGAYRIEVRKEGFEPAELKLNIGVSEFRPIVVKLKSLG